MTRPHVRVMAPADFPFAVALTDTERWGFTVEDFARFLSISPDGCFVVEHGGDRVGVLTTARYGAVGWIGNVIVSGQARGKGLGEALILHAVDHLEKAGARCVRLWAYENTVGLYGKYRFNEDGVQSARWTGFGHSAHETPLASAPLGCAVFPLNPLTLRDIFPLDLAHFGADRSAVLARVAADKSTAGFVARLPGGVPAGYLLAKGSPKGCEIGPWIVAPDAAPWAVPCLLEAALAALEGQSVELGVYTLRRDIEERLADHGFHRGFRTVRMTRGDGETAAENVAGICAIGALEKG